MDLEYRIRMTFGTSPNEPSHMQARSIATDVRYAYENGELHTLKEYADIVKRHCPSAGSWGYKGVDNSDLNTLIALAIAATKRG